MYLRLYLYLNMYYVIFYIYIHLSYTSTTPYRDGPIGLPMNITLRHSNYNNRRRHVTENTSNIVDSSIYKNDMNKNISKATENISLINESANNNPLNFDSNNGEDFTINLNFIPKWLNYIPESMFSAKQFLFKSFKSLSHMGLSSILSQDVFKDSLCDPLSSEIDKLVCMTKAIENINRIVTNGLFILTLNYRILSGGKMAEEALVAMNTLADNPDNISMIKLLGTTLSLYMILMREVVPDRTKVFAGSIMTKLTGLPVVSNIADSSSGGFGRVNVILPRPSRMQRADYDIAKLKSGADEKQLLTYVY